uniref:Uncharacterized protein n=1 Tax=Anguilla anguilla TaxID=7936 RepID=A0A0E9UCG5_ANGAN
MCFTPYLYAVVIILIMIIFNFVFYNL